MSFFRAGAFPSSAALLLVFFDFMLVHFQQGAFQQLNGGINLMVCFFVQVVLEGCGSGFRQESVAVLSICLTIRSAGRINHLAPVGVDEHFPFLLSIIGFTFGAFLFVLSPVCGVMTDGLGSVLICFSVRLLDFGHS